MSENNLQLPHFDLNEICDFISYSEKHKTKEVEIIKTTGIITENNSEHENTKTVREIVTPSNAQFDNIRYDLVKTLMLMILDIETDGKEDDSSLTIGQQLAINTMVENKMLKI